MSAEKSLRAEARALRFDTHTQILGDGMVDVVKKAKPVLESALVFMMARPKRLRPFVVLTDQATGKFVQWCGSLTEGMKFDVPAAGIFEAVTYPVHEAVLRGLEVLSHLAVRPDELPFAEGLVLQEADTHSDLDAPEIEGGRSN